jgi:two-component system, chemotaxis family, chemotaxis protein CheY
MGKTAVIVDDSTSMRQMVSFTLKQSGFTVLEAADGAEGLKHLDGRAISVIITDLNMPVMDGATFIKKARTLTAYKFTPILMLTTESQESKKQEGKSAGATGWIVKPFDPNQLLQTVNKVVP